MATYYKYAERSAESQVNWAEIGKNMTDMLREEVAVREQKKAALNEATRQAAEQISNAPQGAHESARAEAIRLADQATKYLLMQDRLMKQGILDPKDYMISRQNLSDGVKGAYTSMKAFQENYGKLLERAQKDESSMIELKRLEKIQGYGNFSQSGFFIDAPTGNLNVGLKEEQLIDGQKVIGLKKGSSVGMQYIDGAIYGQIDKYKYQDQLKSMADSVGEYVTSTVTPGTFKSIGYVTTLSDARKRINEMGVGENEKKMLYDFYAASFDSIGTMLANENHKASILVDAMASKGYFWTDDPDVAAKNPKAVLEVIDPGTGRGVIQTTKEQDQAASDFLMQQFLGMIDVKETKQSTGQIQRQDPSAAVIASADKKANATNIAQNFVYALTGDANESDSGTKYLSGITGIKFQKLKDSFVVIDENGNKQTFLLNKDDEIANPTKFFKSFIAPLARELDINQDDVVSEFSRLLPSGSKLNLETEASGFDEDSVDNTKPAYQRLTTFVDENTATAIVDVGDLETEEEVADKLNETFGPNLGVEFGVGLAGNTVYVKVNGKESPNYDVGIGKNASAIRKLKKFILDSYAPGTSIAERDLSAETALADLGILD